MAVKIRLKRMGKIRQPYYRVVVVDSRKKRDGRVIEEIGKYHPKREPSLIEVTSDRAQYWLGVGAQPSETVESLLKVTGDWQKFKGLPGAEGSLKQPEAKKDKAEIFNEALKESGSEPKSEAVTKKAAARKADKPKDEKDTAKPKDAEKPKDTGKADKAESTDEEPPVEAGKTPEGAAETGDPQGEAQPAEADATEAAPGAAAGAADDKPAEA